jgi:Uma2 family endonuclease
MAHVTTRSPTVDGVPAREYVPTADHLVTMSMSWDEFESFLALRGDAGPRVTYAEGTLELMSPSRSHETIGGLLGIIVEEYFKHFNIPFMPTGAWLLKNALREVGLEPDKSYVLRDVSKTRPDLAIEVVWTNRRSKLAIYEHLGVAEVWVWKNDALSIYALTSAGYEERDTSLCIPAFDKQLALELLELPFANDITRVLAERLRSKSP